MLFSARLIFQICCKDILDEAKDPLAVDSGILPEEIAFMVASQGIGPNIGRCCFGPAQMRTDRLQDLACHDMDRTSEWTWIIIPPENRSGYGKETAAFLFIETLREEVSDNVRRAWPVLGQYAGDVMDHFQIVDFLVSFLRIRDRRFSGACLILFPAGIV